MQRLIFKINGRMSKEEATKEIVLTKKFGRNEKDVEKLEASGFGKN